MTLEASRLGRREAALFFLGTDGAEEEDRRPSPKPSPTSGRGVRAREPESVPACGRGP